MVSPELLRRYPIFGFMDAAQLRAVAMLAQEVQPGAGETLFEEGRPAGALYLLVEGALELWHVVTDKHEQGRRRELHICDINPGELTGISAVIEPYVYVSTARVTRPARLIGLEAMGLRELCKKDCALGYGLMCQIARAAIERLHDTRVQLVALRA
jgi:CRP-like cAMP-binding protein